MNFCHAAPQETNAGRVVTREEILDTLWGVDDVAESNIVDRQIRNQA
jgi:DNA-binding response OmpR family regulator